LKSSISWPTPAMVWRSCRGWCWNSQYGENFPSRAMRIKTIPGGTNLPKNSMGNTAANGRKSIGPLRFPFRPRPFGRGRTAIDFWAIFKTAAYCGSHTKRGARTRIISARLMGRQERVIYEEG